jgi:hypothetical protein
MKAGASVNIAMLPEALRSKVGRCPAASLELRSIRDKRSILPVDQEPEITARIGNLFQATLKDRVSN